jgi:hypothetical protein
VTNQCDAAWDIDDYRKGIDRRVGPFQGCRCCLSILLAKVLVLRRMDRQHRLLTVSGECSIEAKGIDATLKKLGERRAGLD